MTSSPSPSDVVAHVLVRPASGRRITGDTRITADTLDLYRPRDDDVRTVAGQLAGAGFAVTHPPGIAITIVGAVELFQHFFHAELVEHRPGDLRVSGDVPDPYELPLDAVPRPIADLIESVTLEPPAELVTEPGGEP